MTTVTVTTGNGHGLPWIATPLALATFDEVAAHLSCELEGLPPAAAMTRIKPYQGAARWHAFFRSRFKP